MEHIKGIIIPSEWDGNGRVTGISIASFDERVFRVVNNARTESLKGYLRYRVDAWGEILCDPRGLAVMLSRFRLGEPVGA